MPASAIIVNFNSGAHLSACVSDCAKSAAIDEIIIVDNASSDDSLEQIDPQVQCQIIRNQQNMGFAKASNLGAANAKGSILFFINPDCRFKAKVPAQIIKTMQQENAAAASCLVFNLDGTEQRASRRMLPTFRRSMITSMGMERIWRAAGINQIKTRPPDVPTHVEAVSGAFFAITRQAFEQLEGYDESYFLHCEDLDLFKRLQLASLRIILVPEQKVQHAKGVSSGTSRLAVERHKFQGMKRYYQTHLAQKWPPGTRWISLLALRLNWLKTRLSIALSVKP